jgi:hypothetical protein
VVVERRLDRWWNRATEDAAKECLFGKDVIVVSPAFAVELGGWDGASFVSEVEAEVVKFVGKYSAKTELTRILEIRDDNIRPYRIFKMNELEYGPYPEDAEEGDEEDLGTAAKGKEVVEGSEERVGLKWKALSAEGKVRKWAKGSGSLDEAETVS